MDLRRRHYLTTVPDHHQLDFTVKFVGGIPRPLDRKSYTVLETQFLVLYVDIRVLDLMSPGPRFPTFILKGERGSEGLWINVLKLKTKGLNFETGHGIFRVNL